MRFRLPVLVSLLALAAPAFAQEPTFSPDAIRADVTFLADDLLEGREGALIAGFAMRARAAMTSPSASSPPASPRSA